MAILVTAQLTEVNNCSTCSGIVGLSSSKTLLHHCTHTHTNFGKHNHVAKAVGISRCFVQMSDNALVLYGMVTLRQVSLYNACTSPAILPPRIALTFEQTNPPPPPKKKVKEEKKEKKSRRNGICCVGLFENDQWSFGHPSSFSHYSLLRFAAGASVAGLLVAE